MFHCVVSYPANHNVAKTSLQRRCNVTTLQRRCVLAGIDEVHEVVMLEHLYSSQKDSIRLENFYPFFIRETTFVTSCLLCCVFVRDEVLRPSQPNGIMSSAVSLSNHTFIGQV